MMAGNHGTERVNNDSGLQAEGIGIMSRHMEHD